VENTGIGSVVFTITEAPLSNSTIFSVGVSQEGPSSDSDDLMTFFGVDYIPLTIFNGGPSNWAITGQESSGSTALFKIQFTPIDTSGKNDYDSGTTPFAVFIYYADVVCLKPGTAYAPCGSAQDPSFTDSGAFNFWIFGTTTDPTPEPAAIWLLGSGLVGLSAAVRRKIGKGR
jgi:hypothetical protein